MATTTGSQTTQNWTPINLGDTEADSVVATLGQLEQQMPFLIGLNRDERLRLARIGDRTRAFVDEALAIALDNPGLVPRSVDLAQLQAQADTLGNLEAIRCKVERVLEKITDTESQLANDVYGVARTVYAVMKSPATVPGLTEQKSRLGQRFARKASRPDVSTTTPAKAA